MNSELQDLYLKLIERGLIPKADFNNINLSVIDIQDLKKFEHLILQEQPTNGDTYIVEEAISLLKSAEELLSSLEK